MSQARRAFVVLVSIVAFILGFAPSAFAQNRPAVAMKTAVPAAHAAPAAVHSAASSAPGYWVVASDGSVRSSGAAVFHGSTGGVALHRPIVGMAATPSGNGYWTVASDGGIFSFGDAVFRGSTGAITLNKPIVGMASTPSGNGYWLVASDGGIFSFGDAHFYGSTGAMTLNKPIVGMASTPSGHGYALVASDGGIFSFGDAAFHGSTGAMTLNKPIVGMAFTHSGNGYWMVASDGGVFSFGDATFHGSTGAIMLNQPIVGMAVTPSGNGYWFVAADGGVFSFGDAHFLTATGTTTLTEPAVGMAGSAPMVVIPPATHLSVTTDPSDSTGGVPFVTQPVVHVLDALGATVPDATNPVTLSIVSNPVGVTITCAANPMNAVAGVASFAGCSINKAGTYTLDATSGALTSTTTTATVITVGAAAKLGFVQDASSATSLVNFATQPHVAIQDLGGNTIVGNTSNVTLSITTPAGATLTCGSANPLAAVVGVASFTGCHIDLSGNYTLHAADGVLTAATSSSLSITAAAATKLAFSAQPSASTGGVAFTTQPVVNVEDASGNTVTGDASSVTLTITTPAGAALVCTSANPLTVVAGVGTFTGCNINLAGTYTLHAADAALAPATSASLPITVGAANKLVFTTQPSASTGGVNFGTQPVVKVEDLGGNTVTTDTSTVVLTITTPGGAALTCTNASLPATAGVAAYAACSINLAGTYTLHAADGALTVATSASLAITVGAANKLAFVTQPSASTGGVAFTAQPELAVEDLGGNVVTSDTSSVTLTITTAGGATLTCTSANPLAAVAGIAQYVGCNINLAGSYTLHAADGALTAATSATLPITVGAASKLGFTTQPSASTGGIAFGTQPVVAVQDLGGNTVNTDASAVTLTLTTPAGAVLTCTTNPLTATAGVAAFGACNINLANSYTLHAADGTLTFAVSNTVVISVGAANKLAFTTQPSATTAHTVAFAQQPVVTVQDAGGNTVTSDTSNVLLALTTPAGATLTCTNATPLPAVAGVAAFTGCNISLANTYTLKATDGALILATSISITET